MRTVPEWIGRTDDTPCPASVKLRILDSQDNVCAMTGKPFSTADKPEFDHRVPLWLGGENRESNIHAILASIHKPKTAAEAKVRAKVKRIKAKMLGIHKPKTSFATNRNGAFIKRMDGSVERR